VITPVPSVGLYDRAILGAVLGLEMLRRLRH